MMRLTGRRGALRRVACVGVQAPLPAPPIRLRSRSRVAPPWKLLLLLRLVVVLVRLPMVGRRTGPSAVGGEDCMRALPGRMEGMRTGCGSEEEPPKVLVRTRDSVKLWAVLERLRKVGRGAWVWAVEAWPGQFWRTRRSSWAQRSW